MRTRGRHRAPAAADLRPVATGHDPCCLNPTHLAQVDVYNTVAKPIVDDAMKGINRHDLLLRPDRVRLAGIYPPQRAVKV
jgi:hypothetical protein